MQLWGISVAYQQAGLAMITIGGIVYSIGRQHVVATDSRQVREGYDEVHCASRVAPHYS